MVSSVAQDEEGPPAKEIVLRSRGSASKASVIATRSCTGASQAGVYYSRGSTTLRTSRTTLSTPSPSQASIYYSRGSTTLGTPRTTLSTPSPRPEEKERR